MVKIRWLSEYLRKNGSRVQIDFDVFYFVQALNGTKKIFSHITGNEQRALREHGLLNQ